MQNLEHFLWAKATDIPMDPKTFGLLVAILFFLISFLINLLQRRYSRTRLDRMLEKDESVLNFLGVIDEYLGKLERTCTFELHGKTSPQEVGKAIYVARNKIQSTIANIGEHLYSFRQYRGKKTRQLKRVHERTSKTCNTKISDSARLPSRSSRHRFGQESGLRGG